MLLRSGLPARSRGTRAEWQDEAAGGEVVGGNVGHDADLMSSAERRIKCAGTVGTRWKFPAKVQFPVNDGSAERLAPFL